MADERDDLSFRTGELADLGITSTKKFVNAGESFLNGNFDDLEILDDTEEDLLKKPVTQKTPPSNTQSKAPQSKTPPTSTPVTKTTTPSKELSEEDAFKLLNGEVEEDNEEVKEEDEDAIVVKKKEVKEKEEDKEDAIVVKKSLPATAQKTTEETKEEDEVDIYNAIAQEMVNEGIFEAEEDEEGNPVAPEIKSPEELRDMFVQTARRMAEETIENFLNSKGEEARDVFNNVIAKGVNPKDYLSRYARIQDFKTLDLTNEGDQEKLVRELYISEGRSSEYIDRKIKQYKETSDLATEAEDAQKILIQKESENIRLLAENKTKEDAEKARVQNIWVSNVAKILNEKAKAQDFDSIPVNNQIAQETYKYLTEHKYRLGDQLLTEFDSDLLSLNRPENHSMKVKLALLLNMLKTDPKLSKLSKKAVSKEASEAFSVLRKRNNKAGGTTKTAPASKGGTEEKQETETEPRSWFGK